MGTKVSDENLDILIKGLEDYAVQGVYDPWILKSGAIIQPLDVLKELKEARETLRDQRAIRALERLTPQQIAELRTWLDGLE